MTSLLPPSVDFNTWKSALIGSILGTALGDAIGLPYEGLSRGRARRMFGPPARHRFLLGHGMVSDDTEHVCLVAQSLIATGGRNVDAFRNDLARRLRWWLVFLPAGTGLATLRSVLKLWIGFDPRRSGVFSAGNGPAMRAGLLGVALSDDEQWPQFVRASTRITHTDPKAEHGAVAVALAARMASRSESVSGQEYVTALKSILRVDVELIALIQQAVDSVEQSETTPSFAEQLGLGRGVSGYVHHCIPVVIHAWLRTPNDFRSAVSSVIACGGDADSTGAMVGSIVGASELPHDWLDGLWEWPRTADWMEHLGQQLAEALATGKPSPPPTLPVSGLLARNLVFLAVVLFHGFRRLAPPY